MIKPTLTPMLYDAHGDMVQECSACRRWELVSRTISWGFTSGGGLSLCPDCHECARTLAERPCPRIHPMDDVDAKLIEADRMVLASEAVYTGEIGKLQRRLDEVSKDHAAACEREVALEAKEAQLRARLEQAQIDSANDADEKLRLIEEARSWRAVAERLENEKAMLSDNVRAERERQ